MSSTEETGGVISPFDRNVSDKERKLATDDDASTISLFLISPVDPNLNVANREGEDCVRRALEEAAASVASHSECRAEEASEGESLVDIKGSLKRETRVESERFTSADILQRADFSSTTLLEGVVSALDFPLC